MWNSIRAAIRLIATAVGVAHEPSYVIVRVRRRRDEAARAFGERAA